MTSIFAQDSKQSLRDGLLRSLREPEAIQYVSFGPLKDGRTEKFEVHYHNEFEPPALMRPHRSGPYIIKNPRQSIARIPIIMDAMIGCAQEPSLCSKMTAFLDTVSSTSAVEDIPFFDEFFPESEPIFKQYRGTPAWANAIQNGFSSAVLVVNLHEICHAVLGHLDLLMHDNVDIVKLEAEADGCVIAFLEITELSGIGGMAYLMDAMFREEQFGEFRLNHPSPRCRMIALFDTISDWFLEHSQAIRDAAEKSDGALRIPEDLMLFGDLTSARSECTKYLEATYVGAQQGRVLFDKNTQLHSAP